METRLLTRRCAGFKNVSMWMDEILTWDESDRATATNRRFIKAFKPKPKSSVFVKSEHIPLWNSESRESFKPYDVTKLDHICEGAHARIASKLLKLKASHAVVEKENDTGLGNRPVSEEKSGEQEPNSAERQNVQSVQELPQPLPEPKATESIAVVPGDPDLDKDDTCQLDGGRSVSACEQDSPEVHKPHSNILLPHPVGKKKSKVSERTNEDEARRQKARQLIKAKWEARRYAQASRAISSTRHLSDTAVAFLLGRRPFATFADQTGSQAKDSTRLSFNINPELYPNQPARIQTADSAVERAILKNGAQPIGCRQRIKMLQNMQVRKRLERRQESLSRLSKSTICRHNEDQPVANSRQSKQSSSSTGRAEGFFVKI